MEKLRFAISPFKKKDAITFLRQKKTVKVFQEHWCSQTLDKGKSCSLSAFGNYCFYLFIEV